jgi:phosphoribosylformylglycinamidine synthase
VLSANGRVLGMMPHPERAIEAAAVPGLGGDDGRRLFAGLLNSLASA